MLLFLWGREEERDGDRDIYKRESMLVCEHKEDQERIIFFLEMSLVGIKLVYMRERQKKKHEIKQ